MRTVAPESRVPHMKLVALAVASCFASVAFANPDGPATALGSVNMSGLGTSSLTVTNAGVTNAIINWNGFSIPAGEVTRFRNFVNLSVLNRVTGPDMSRILGELHSDGRLFLINQNGIMIGAGATIDVPGLVASTLSMTNDDFMSGRMQFQNGAGAGPLDNQANIAVPAGGQVYMIGNTVTNGGVITSPNGDVVLAAGNSVELMDTGVPGLSVSISAPGNEALNMGQIFAGAGRVGIFAGVVNQGRAGSANSAVIAADGSIKLVATDATTFAAGSNASGGGLDIDTGSLTVAGNVNTGTQSIHATGGVVVENGALNASIGQTIEAQYVEVNASAGGAGIFNGAGEQAILTHGANTAGEGLAVRGSAGRVAAIVANSGNQRIEVRNAERASIDGEAGTAQVVDIDGVQTVSLTGTGANALVLGASGGPGQSVIGGGGFQAVHAGDPGELGSITIQGSNSGMPSNPVFGGTQTISTSGALTIRGGTTPGGVGVGISANGVNGQQTISAQSIVLEGGSSGSGNSAAIHANNGSSQNINAGPGGITLRGGADGANNFVQINQASTDPTATQTITSAGPVRLESGAGNFNFTMIRSFGGHQGLSLGDTTLLAGAGGIDNFAVIQGRDQDITVHGNLALIGQGSSGSPTIGGGARIGGLGGGAPSPTSLRLNVDNDFSMTGGSVSGTLLGNTTNFTGDTHISVHAGGNVSVNGGTEHGVYSAIGSRAGNEAGGDIDITAGGTIALNSTSFDQASIIRTTDDVTLNAQQVTQGPDAFIQAHTLTVNTQQGAALTGDNAVDAFNATNAWFGDVTLRNASPLLTVTGVLNWAGGLQLQQTGDMRVNGDVFSGPQDINVSGGLVVQNDPFLYAQLAASGGQRINAGYVEVDGQAGGGAFVSNYGGDQSIATTGGNAAAESLAIRSAGGAFAAVTSSGGAQSILLSGPGPNALVMENLGGGSATNISGDVQTITAGNPGEAGSITLRGAGSQISSNPIAGGTQTVRTSGTLSLVGSATEFSFAPAGIFAIGDGPQTVRADAIRLQGGDGGNGAVIVAIDGSQRVEAGAGGIALTGAAAPGNGGVSIVQQATGLGLTQTVRSAGAISLQGGSVGGGNSAVIVGNGGSQLVEAGTGGISLMGGASGGGNLAMINQVSSDPAAAQTVQSAGPVTLRGGGGGNLNFAMIRAFGGQQSLSFGHTSLLAGAGGTDDFATIQGRQQDVAVHGDLVIAADGSAGSPDIGGGARIGGLGGAASSATDLTLDVDGDFTMTAGNVPGTGASLGGHLPGDVPTDVALTVGGNIGLNGGTAPDTNARIGAATVGVRPGSITIVAGGTIALNSTSPDQASIIRTTDGVSLFARQISQGPHSRIEAGSLAVKTDQGASLAGNNSVSVLNMLNSSSGNVSINNTSALLTVTGIDQVSNGALNLNQDGNLLVTGDATSGPQSINATGDMTIRPGAGSNVTVQAHGAQTFNVGGSFGLLGGTAWFGHAQTLASGPVRIATGDDLDVRGGGGLLAYALLYGGDGIRLTVGDELHVDRGRGPLAFARVQTSLWDRIFLDFPNRSSGGYYVDGREGVSSRGLDGFFTGFLPARRGRGLIVSYGE